MAYRNATNPLKCTNFVFYRQRWEDCNVNVRAAYTSSAGRAYVENVQELEAIGWALEEYAQPEPLSQRAITELLR